MLRITQQDCSKAAKRYYSSADYYSEGQELIGLWGGKGAERLGLKGTVDKQAFDHLCDNIDPNDGKPLTVRTRSDRTVGYDFTFSVPKSVSLLYALGNDDRILEAFRSAVDETMRDIESEMKTRVRRGRRDLDRETGNMVWAEFIHRTSRPVDGVPDPQLHAHCFVFNTTFDGEEERWKAGQFRQLKADAPFFQAAFRLRLAERMQDLGYGIERKRDDFELAGFTPAMLKSFSRRTEEIEKVAAEKGITDPDKKAELGAETRKRKTADKEWGELQNLWYRKLSQDQQAVLEDAIHSDLPFAKETGGEGMAVDHALKHCFTREAVVKERKLLTEAMKRAIGTASVADVQRELGSRSIIRRIKDGARLVTTKEVLAEESRMIGFARQGRGRFRPFGKMDRPFKRDWLNRGQKAAVMHVLGSRDRVTLIRGAAGTGKTTMMQEAVEALREAGKDVVIVAPTVNASHEVLRSEGFTDAETVARLLKDKEMQERARGQVIWVDEAGLLGTQDMVKLFDLAASVDARLVLSGDRRQHRSVLRGEPLRLLEQKAGLPVVELTEIKRQETHEYQQVVKLLSEERISEAFENLDAMGCIREVRGEDRYRQMADAYLAVSSEKRSNGARATALVVSPTHAEGAWITHTIREILKSQQKLGEEKVFATWRPANLTEAEKADPVNYGPGDMLQFMEHAKGIRKGSRIVVADGTAVPVQYAARFEVYRSGTLKLAAGDRIRITANGWSKDHKHRLNNGTLHDVKGFNRQGDIVLGNDWVIDKSFGHIAHGYVVTSHAAQGASVDKVLIGQSSLSLPATNRRQFYVSISRGKKEAIVFTDDKEELLKAARKADTPLAASDLVEREAFRSRLRRHVRHVARAISGREAFVPPSLEAGREYAYE